MSAMASQITSLAIVNSTVYSRRGSKKTSKLRVTGLCEGNSPVAGEFPAQTQRTHNAIMTQDNVFTTSTRRRRRRVDVVKTLLLRPVPAGKGQ